jgi:hypothetical protein
MTNTAATIRAVLAAGDNLDNLAAPGDVCPCGAPGLVTITIGTESHPWCGQEDPRAVDSDHFDYWAALVKP